MQFDTILKGVALLAASSAAIVRNINSPEVNSRADTGTPRKLLCSLVSGHAWGRVTYSSAWQAIADLRNRGPLLGIDPHHCERLNCVQDAAIYWCNDNTDSKWVQTERLVQMAQGIQGDCYHYIPGSGAFTGGQLFDTEDFNVIILQQSCFSGRRTVKREELTADTESRGVDVTPINLNELAARAEAGSPVALKCIPDLEGWEYPDYMTIMWGTVHVDSLNRDLDVDPWTCRKVWCTANSGIYVCNPNAGTLKVQSRDVSGLVKAIASSCKAGDLTGGQVWDTDNYFVQVRGGPC